MFIDKYKIFLKENLEKKTTFVYLTKKEKKRKNRKKKKWKRSVAVTLTLKLNQLHKKYRSTNKSSKRAQIVN